MGRLLAGVVLGQASLKLAPAVGARGAPPDFLKDVDGGFKGYATIAEGVKIKELAEGLGDAPQDGDLVRFQFAAYLQDGTMLSRMEGSEQKAVLGGREIPPGLEAGLLGMKAGGQRLLVIPPAAGWSTKYRFRHTRDPTPNPNPKPSKP